jgi:hypothetical protein
MCPNSSTMPTQVCNRAQRYSTLLDASWRFSTLLDATRRYSTLLDATQRYSTLLDATWRYSTLLDATRCTDRKDWIKLWPSWYHWDQVVTKLWSRWYHWDQLSGYATPSYFKTTPSFSTYYSQLDAIQTLEDLKSMILNHDFKSNFAWSWS